LKTQNPFTTAADLERKVTEVKNHLQSTTATTEEKSTPSKDEEAVAMTLRSKKKF